MGSPLRGIILSQILPGEFPKPRDPDEGPSKLEFLSKVLAAQSSSAPNLVKGEYKYDYGDHAEKTPLLKMYTLGHQTDMVPIKADRLRYHAAAPFISYLKHLGHIDAMAYPEDEREVFKAARTFVQVEVFLPPLNQRTRFEPPSIKHWSVNARTQRKS